MRKLILPAAVLIVGLSLVWLGSGPKSGLTSPPPGIGVVPQATREIKVLPPAGYVIEQLARKGHTGPLEVLIEQGYDVDSTREDGGTALMGAAMDNHVETVTLLIERGADVDMQTTDTGATALMLAVIPALCLLHIF